MKGPKLLAAGAALGLVTAGILSFDYYNLTGWTDESTDPYTWKSVCRETTGFEIYGKFFYKESPNLPESQCSGDMNYWLTQTPQEGCSVDRETLTAKCDEGDKSS